MTQALTARPRPALLRALGHQEPPTSIHCDGHTYELQHVLKHDSWAASAVYVGSAGRIKVKFNRIEPILGLPTVWLGNLLARREAWMLHQLADLPAIPNVCGPVYAHGKRLRHAVAHQWIPGHPLGKEEAVSDEFFPRLMQTLAEVHRRGIAYVDLHKRENIIVGEDCKPYLIDFQISQALPSCWIFHTRFHRAVLEILQQSDWYHLLKHRLHHRPDLVPAGESDLDASRPWWIRLHRCIAQPFRHIRRQCLVRLNVRTGPGHATSEHFPEDAVQAELRRVA
jgi:hypothetical protein